MATKRKKKTARKRRPAPAAVGDAKEQLARAYLEIGDREGARDMLQQALSGARDPDHRRQIEELLQQIS